MNDSGRDIVFGEYDEARGHLIQRLGEYCSYCEMHVDSGLAVEHIKPKNIYPTDELNWSNFLLACPNCNSIKGRVNVVPGDYFWPDRDNTALVIWYLSGGRVQVAPGLLAEETERALNTIRLIKLDRLPDNDPAVPNRRWNNRREAWDMALDAKDTLLETDTPKVRHLIANSAKSN